MLVQPETQHRARYLTEGSRGSVKDRTQQGFPTIKVGQERILTAYWQWDDRHITQRTKTKPNTIVLC